MRAFSGLAKVAMVDKRPAQDHSAPPIDLQAQKTAAYNTLEGLRERWKRENEIAGEREREKRNKSDGGEHKPLVSAKP